MIVIRRGDRLDVPFLRSLLAHAYGRHVSALETEIPISRYVDNWGRRGDTALIAMDEGHSVGAGWYRLFNDAAHGYAYVDAETPELTIVVVPSRQGEGIGEELLAALVLRAESDGFPGLSVSVDADNPERDALVANSFELVSQSDWTLTMRRQLGRGTRAAGDIARAARH
jgi:GNAT superfamily N-acetyltransferase